MRRKSTLGAGKIAYASPQIVIKDIKSKPSTEYPMDKDALNRSAIIIYNLDNDKSLEIADYYILQRGPNANRSNRFTSIEKLGFHFGNYPDSVDVDGEEITPTGTHYHRAEIDIILGTSIQDLAQSLNEIPGYFIISKNCPLDFDIGMLSNYGYTITESLEYNIYKRMLDAGHLVSVTRLEGRTAQHVKDIIDRSIFSDSCGQTNQTAVVNNVGGHWNSCHLNGLVDIATSIPMNLSWTIFDNEVIPKPLGIPITQKTMFYEDLSAIYLTYGQSKARNVLCNLSPTILEDNSEGKNMDEIPDGYNACTHWGQDFVDILFHPNEFDTDSVTLDSIPLTYDYNGLFTVSSISFGDYNVGDMIHLQLTTHRDPTAQVHTSYINAYVVSYDPEEGILTLRPNGEYSPSSPADIASIGTNAYVAGDNMQIAHWRRCIVGSDIKFSTDYTKPQTITWYNGRPEQSYWYPCDRAIIDVLLKYEQIEFDPGAFTFVMNSACGSVGGLCKNSKYTRDTVYTFYSLMNRENGATLAIGCPSEPYGGGLGDVSIISAMLMAGYNFGTASINGSLIFYRSNIVGDPLCTPFLRSPLFSLYQYYPKENTLYGPINYV